MTIRYTPPLLIGELQADVAVNEQGVTYIAIAPLCDSPAAVSMDEIEARALCRWLATSLGYTLTDK